MNSLYPYWCRSCHQEFDPLKDETPAQAHKRIWKQSMGGRCDNPQIERKPGRIPRSRGPKPEVVGLPLDAGEPLIIQ